MALKTTKWDVNDFLDSQERMALFLAAAFEDGDPALIAAAIGEVARARGMTQTARDTGLTREALYRALSTEGRPEFNTIMKVLHSFGLKLAPVPVDKAKSPRSQGSTRVRNAG
jgi:probable addiction module antidote protein